MSQGWKLDGTDFFNYGVWVSKSSGVLDMPKMVDTSDNWLNLDGKDYWQPISDVKYQNNEIVLNCFIEADSYANFKTAVDTFYTALMADNQRQLTAPYLVATIECYVARGIKVKASNYIRTQQIGIFSLVLTVQNDSKYKQITIYKSDDTVRGVFNYDDKFKITKKLQGSNSASFSIESSTITSIERNDYVLLSHVTGTTDKYYLERDPEVKKSSTNKYITPLRFEYEGYLLNRIDFLILDDAETAYWGTAEDVIDRLLENVAIDYSGIFVKGTISSTTNKNHYFSNQTCYQVLQQMAKDYELEFDLKTVGGSVEISLIPQIGTSVTPGLEYGKGNGLYELTRDSINNEDLTTVLHAFGSTKNLPATYVNVRLKCTTFPIESNKTTYGAYSKTKNFDEIFPEYTGTISGYSTTLIDDGVDLTQYIITDSGLTFDINSYLLEATTAKIVFKTGDLSGYEFQIKRYDNVTKEIYFIEFKNPRGGILPDATIKPAIGDTYTLVDIDLPASYLTDAESRLLIAANAYIATKDDPKVTYRGIVSRGYQYDVTLNGYDIGDKVPITDTDFGLVSSEQRISDLTYNIYYGGYDLILSEAPLITFRENIIQRLNEVEKTQDANEDQEVTEIRKRRTTGYEVATDLLEPSDQTIRHDDRTRRSTIDSRHLDYESNTLDYSVKRLAVECNIENDNNKIRIEAGSLVIHNWRPSTLNRYDIRDVTNDYINPENYNPIREFTIAETDITFPDDTGQFLYAKVPNDGISTTGTIESYSDIHRRVHYDPDYFYYKLGYINDASSPRYAFMLWGNVKSIQPNADEKTITQTAHGFTAGQVIRLSGSTWVLALADAVDNANAMAFVSIIVDVDNFKIKASGYIEGSFTEGSEYFLSPIVSGSAITLPDPEVWVVGQVRVPLGWGTEFGFKIELQTGEEITEYTFTEEIKEEINISINEGSINEAISTEITTAISSCKEKFLINPTSNASETQLSSWFVVNSWESIGVYTVSITVRDTITDTVYSLKNMLSFDYLNSPGVVKDNTIVIDTITLTLGVNGSSNLYATVSGMSTNAKSVFLCFERCVLGESTGFMTASGSFEFGGTASMVEDILYGYLYNWYAGIDSRNIANTGWSVPTNANFVTLRSYLDPGGSDSSNTAGGDMKESGTTYWNTPNTGADNSSKFNGRGHGRRTGTTGLFVNQLERDDYWCFDEYNSASAWISELWYNSEIFTSGNIISEKDYGLSIRLLKDSTTLSNGETAVYVGNDGKVYRTICIGTQEWLADNLSETEYRNNDTIPTETDGIIWGGLTTGAKCAYNNDESNV